MPLFSTATIWRNRAKWGSRAIALAGLVRKLYGESVLAEYRRAVDRVECQGF